MFTTILLMIRIDVQGPCCTEKLRYPKLISFQTMSLLSYKTATLLHYIARWRRMSSIRKTLPRVKKKKLGEVLYP